MTRLVIALGLIGLTFSKGSFGATKLEDVLSQYEQVQTRLAADDYKATADAAAKAIPVIEDFEKTLPASDPQLVYTRRMFDGAKLLSQGKTEDELRVAFSPFSDGAVHLANGDKASRDIRQLYWCHMVKGRFAYWMQKKTATMANPYMGLKMLKCGIKKTWDKLPVK